MSDDVSRQCFWSENNAKPEQTSRAPRLPRGKESVRQLRALVEATHVLMVRRAGERAWHTVASDDRLVSGSEAFGAADLEIKARHFPANEWRVWSWPDARRELRRKMWSIHDADHIANGERVMLAATPSQLHPDIDKVRKAFEIQGSGHERRYGIVTSRARRTGQYMVRVEDGDGWSVGVIRADLIYPVPENLVAFQRRSS